MASKTRQRGALDFTQRSHRCRVERTVRTPLERKMELRPFETCEKNKTSSSFAKPCELALAYDDDILGVGELHDKKKRQVIF